ncbi:malonyl-ACP O-methyltransferase BioC [Marinobacter sp. F4216]|uniref:malonyl-ACP O-methyltransferase BioC n=1 Tax=Marinobacter sp. F4216 TaxID=2874281 RepID=UPI001CBE6334|nr:malonyl-ACP O-methyltransferase BioC [Marinobacter sp. F4216]
MNAALHTLVGPDLSECQNDLPIADKVDIAREFGVASATYEQASRLQRLMGNVMIAELSRAGFQGERALDVGCGTGWFTRALAGMASVGRVTGVDLSAGMVERARNNVTGDVSWLVADAEHLPLPDDSVDLIFSNLMIQWCSDPVPVLLECRRLLRPGGRLMLSTLMDGTLNELKKAWEVADPGRPHVNRFEPEHRLRELVTQALPGAQFVRRTIALPYDSPLALTGELKQLGAGFKGDARRKTLTGPGRVRAMCKAYPRQPDGSVAASYEAAWVYWQA